MGIFNKINKSLVLGKNLSSYGYQRLKSLSDPEMIRLTNDLTMKWIQIGELKADHALDRAIELSTLKLEEAKSSKDSFSIRKSQRKAQLQDAVDKADYYLDSYNGGSVDEEYELMKKQIKELEDLKNKQAKELKDLKNKNK
ncbi:hypothetical protein [uncultured Methanobrevibacter sp.]|uniref:hypothetical protein n=1 Tax=uncultured Methanobrevibacter sp. TaxID=253161 RepID=UPI0025DE5F53|nr:hypothetical protein [uncultured Methanobrevibacter sp.]